jgi:hypothetical protein
MNLKQACRDYVAVLAREILALNATVAAKVKERDRIVAFAETLNDNGVIVTRRRGRPRKQEAAKKERRGRVAQSDKKPLTDIAKAIINRTSGPLPVSAIVEKLPERKYIDTSAKGDLTPNVRMACEALARKGEVKKVEVEGGVAFEKAA